MKKTISILAFSLAGSALLAQNLNPTVEVTNTYDAAVAPAAKPRQEVAVPDSVLVFNLDFDYDALDKPYQGSYEFRPYRVELLPQGTVSTENKFYLRAGAGYAFHPELDLVWSPLRTDVFRMNLTAVHRSYFGNYWDVQPQTDFRITSGKDRWSGADMGNRVAMDASYEYGGGKVSFLAGWENAYNRLPALKRNFNGAVLEARLDQLRTRTEYDYGARALVRSGSHSQQWVDDSRDKFSDTRVELEGHFGMPVGSSRVKLEAGMTYDGTSSASLTRLQATPHYLMTFGDLSLDLGVRVEGTFRSRADFMPHKAGILFPAVRAEYRLLNDQMVIQASITGRNHASLPYDLLSQSRFLALPALSAQWDNSIERIRLMLGIRGAVAARAAYDLQIGYTRWLNGLLPSYDLFGGPLPFFLGYADCHLFFANLELGWKSDEWDALAHLKFSKAIVDTDGVTAPAPFAGDATLLYDWGGRIRAGLSGEWAAARGMRALGNRYRVPGYFDLGVYAEYAFTRRFGVWGRAGNLLNQRIQRIPGISEAGIWFTAGIRLNF